MSKSNKIKWSVKPMPLKFPSGLVSLQIDNQTFYLQDIYDNDPPAEQVKIRKWYAKQLKSAIKKLIEDNNDSV